MRVMLLVTDLERGGTPLRIARLARGLRDEGIEVHVGCLAPAGPVSADLERAGIATFNCGARHARDAAALWRLARHAKRIKPDLIHSTLTHANVAARLIGLWRGVPVLSSTATIEVERRWHLWAERLTARLDRGHVVNSCALAEHVRRTFRLPWSRIHVVPPSIGDPPRRIDRGEARRQLDIAEHEFVVLWIGRLDPVKRLDIAIGCAEILSSVPSRLLLVGDGTCRPAVERMIRLSSASGSIHLLGWQNDLRAVMSAADLFLFPSLTEGMPNAVLEAMAFGLPIVASDIPTLRELAGLSHIPTAFDRTNASDAKSISGTHGFEVPGALNESAADTGVPRLELVDSDQPKPYADALLRLRANPARAGLLAQRAAKWVLETLDPQKTASALIASYRRIIGHHSSRS